MQHWQPWATSVCVFFRSTCLLLLFSGFWVSTSRSRSYKPHTSFTSSCQWVYPHVTAFSIQYLCSPNKSTWCPHWQRNAALQPCCIGCKTCYCTCYKYHSYDPMILINPCVSTFCLA
ncbi:hypothetical protein BJY52DRAFT_199626 [Lactarius psammicola]|nr:hypothetical protein BJY52DRAFT_199626 [Lactarius psammicola]